MNSQVRDIDLSRMGTKSEEDPFADLAQMFESELRRDPRAARRPAARGGGAASDAEFDAAFARALSEEAPRAIARPTRKGLGNAEVDAELESVLRGLSAPARPRNTIVVETQSFAPERVADEPPIEAPPLEMDEFDQLIQSELAVLKAPVAGRSMRGPKPHAPEPAWEPETYEAGDPAGSFDAFDAPSPMAGRQPKGGRKLMMAGTALVLLVIAGAGGAYVLRGGVAGLDAIGGEPLLIKADAEPYKIAPKDPGGRAYPNQNKAVYDRVAAGANAPAAPTQQALVQDAEEPMALPAEDAAPNYADNLPGVELGEDGSFDAKDEARFAANEAPATSDAVEAVLQPRKVRTMVVGPDGRLVPSGAPPAPVEVADASPARATPAAPAAEESNPYAVQQIAEPVSAAMPVVPAPAAVADVAPPADIAPMTTASLPTGGYFVQIASQPSEAAAQQSMRNMTSRYASAIGGRAVGIQSAEIAGKGTFYRVRVAASSKDDAASVCSRLKSAGASCFVSR